MTQRVGSVVCAAGGAVELDASRDAGISGSGGAGRNDGRMGKGWFMLQEVGCEQVGDACGEGRKCLTSTDAGVWISSVEVDLSWLVGHVQQRGGLYDSSSLHKTQVHIEDGHLQDVTIL